MSKPFTPTRRDVIRWGMGAGAVGLAAGATPLLSACGGATSTTSGNAANANLPDYVPLTSGPPPMYPALATGVEAGYTSFPANPPQSVTKSPLKGDTVTGFCQIYNPPPTPMAGNAEWKEANKRLGGTVDINYVGADDYQTKVATLMAGDSLPDLLQIDVPLVSNLYPFLQAKCVDLTPMLGGASVKKYPNLANLPTFTWKASVLNGSIWGVPVPRAHMGNPLYVHQEMLDALGNPAMKNGDDVLKVLKELTRPSENRWAITAATGLAYRYLFAQYLFGVPNNWKVDKDGHFTSAFETEENKEAVAYWRKAVAAGVVVPDSEGFTNAQMKDAFNSGRAAMVMDGWASTFDAYWAAMTAINPDAKLRLMVLPGHSGGKQTFYSSTGIYSFTSIPQSSKSKVDELLGVLNFLAAPFGTAEYLLLNYGVEGVDYTAGPGGNPVPTAQGKVDDTIPWLYLAAGPAVRYNATTPDATKYAYQGEKELMPLAIPDPTVGLYSATNSTRGPVLTTNFTDGITDIIAGRRPVSDYSKLVSAWRSAGGNQIKSEFQKAYQAGKKKGGKS